MGVDPTASQWHELRGRITDSLIGWTLSIGAVIVDEEIDYIVDEVMHATFDALREADRER